MKQMNVLSDLVCVFAVSTWVKYYSFLKPLDLLPYREAYKLVLLVGSPTLTDQRVWAIESLLWTWTEELSWTRLMLS